MSQNIPTEQGEVLSYREFARRLDISDTAVRKAIRDAENPTGCLNMSKTRKGARPALIFEVALLEWKQSGNKIGDASVHHPDYREPQPEDDYDEIEEPAGQSIGIRNTEGDDVLARAKRLNVVMAAKLKEQQYRIKEGELVEKKAVYAVFFSFGADLRRELLAIPNNIHDQMVNMIVNGRTKDSFNLLYETIEKKLEELATGPSDRKITEYGNEVEDAEEE